MKSPCAAGDGHGMLNSNEAREFRLQFLNFLQRMDAVVAKQRLRLDQTKGRLDFRGIHEMDAGEFERQRFGADRFSAVNREFFFVHASPRNSYAFTGKVSLTARKTPCSS